MRPGVWQRLDHWARALTPAGLTLALVVVNAVPLQVPGLTPVLPVLALIGVFHWAIYRPELLPPFAVFIAGLLQDTLAGTPIGVYVLVFLAVYGGVVFQQRFFLGKSFTIVWVGFAIVAALASVATWTLVAILYGTLIDPRPVVFQLFLTVGVYPAVAWLLMRWQNAVVPAEE